MKRKKKERRIKEREKGRNKQRKLSQINIRLEKLSRITKKYTHLQVIKEGKPKKQLD